MTNKQLEEWFLSPTPLPLPEQRALCRELQLTRARLAVLEQRPIDGIPLYPVTGNANYAPKVTPIKGPSYLPRGPILSNKRIDTLVKEGRYGSDRQRRAMEEHITTKKQTAAVKTNGGFDAMLSKLLKTT